MNTATATPKPIKVFFDSNTLIQVGLPPGNETFLRLADLVEYGFINVVTTDLTKTEIVRHHSEFAFKRLQSLFDRRSRPLAARYFDLEVPDISEADARNQIRSRIADGVDEMFASLRAVVLKIDEVNPSDIFSEYDQNIGFFGTHSKKNQFPDAFVFACLKSEASADDQLLIVTDDPDFRGPAEGTDYINVVDSIEGLFGELHLLTGVPDPDLEPFLYHELMQNIDFLMYVESDDWDFVDFRIGSTCITIDFDSIVAFQQVNENAPLLVSARVVVPLDLEIDHLDEGPTENRTGSARVSFYASIATDDSGEPHSIADLRVFDCSVDFGVIWLAYDL